MKKFILVGALSLVLSLAVATFVHAQTARPSPTTTPTTTLPAGAPNTGF